MVVDDHRVSRQFTVAALRQFTPDVKEAVSLRTAEALAARWRPDVILVDLELPDGNGLQLARRLRSNWPSAREQPRFIVLTGHRRYSPDGGHREWRGIPLLIKPVSLSCLKKAVLGDAPGDPAADQPVNALPELRRLFREELATDLTALEAAIASRDRPRAASILHRLIASSALCGEAALEDALRTLDAALRGQAPAGQLAGAWVRVLNRADGLSAR